MILTIAVGVAAMEELDADDKRLSYQGHVADRDIVQVFVCYYVTVCHS